MASETCRHTFKTAIVQGSPALGDMERNIAAYAKTVDEARQGGARLVVFPELSLTGYLLRDVVPDVAIRLDGETAERICDAARGIDVVVGCVEESRDHRFYNSALYISDGQILHIHRKVYLPTYGMFDEQRYFAAGNRIRAFDTPLGRMGMLICEDLWHLSAGLILGLDGIEFLIAPAASPGRGLESGSDFQSARLWEQLVQVYANFFGIYVLFCNRVGFEDGVNFWGGSQIVAPGGAPLARGPDFEPIVLTAEVDKRALRRQRIYSPLGRDEKLALTISELERIYRESRD